MPCCAPSPTPREPTAQGTRELPLPATATPQAGVAHRLGPRDDAPRGGRFLCPAPAPSGPTDGAVSVPLAPHRRDVRGRKQPRPAVALPAAATGKSVAQTRGGVFSRARSPPALARVTPRGVNVPVGINRAVGQQPRQADSAGATDGGATSPRTAPDAACL